MSPSGAFAILVSCSRRRSYQRKRAWVSAPVAGLERIALPVQNGHFSCLSLLIITCNVVSKSRRTRDGNNSPGIYPSQEACVCGAFSIFFFFASSSEPQAAPLASIEPIWNTCYLLFSISRLAERAECPSHRPAHNCSTAEDELCLARDGGPVTSEATLTACNWG